MGYEELFDLNCVQIKTTVTSKEKKVDDILWTFLHRADNDMKVIGLDAEWLLIQEPEETDDFYSETECATLQLCDGSSCLIIQLLHLDSIPKSLLNFLRLPDYTFVGVGIKDNLAKLEKHYGIGCKNAVELGQMAAAVMNMPRLSFCGVDELARVVSRVDLRNYRPLAVVFKDWGQNNLSRKQAKLATINVYSYYNIGSNLLHRQYLV